jgi:predicted DNA-binding protein with PD1-like motif
MRRVEHPGPIAAQRRRTADCDIRHAQVKLPPGEALLPTLASLLEANHVKSAVARLRGGSFNPFAYCMPALSPTPEHAVYFSDRYQPRGTVRLERASVTVGQRELQPWLHCHGIWHDAGGQRLGGHVLPNDAVISEPIDASVWFLEGASFEVVASAETGFSLFEPVAASAFTPREHGPFAMSIRPNEDFCTALEEECRTRGIIRARVHGGVGSLVGATFDDGREVVPFVTEVFIRDGLVATTEQGELAAQIDVALVDHLGGLNEGRLRRAANPVLVTFELLVEPIEFAPYENESSG